MAAENGDTVTIPVIDISEENKNAAEDLVDAAAKYGFVFVKNNIAGIPPSEISQMFNLSETLFKSSVEVKETCSINSAKSGKNRGWLAMHTETLDPAKQKRGDFKEAFNIGEFKDGHPQQPFPEPLAVQETTVGHFMNSCHELCNRIHVLFAQGLQISESAGGSSWFSSRHDRIKGPSGSILRLLYYPSIPSSLLPEGETDIRAGAHSDYGSITLLFQLPGQPGLEIRIPSGTSWSPVPVNPHNEAALPILVNIGDLLSYWTGGLFKSTVHRVIFPKAQNGEAIGDRYSIAYFCHPLDKAELVEVPSPVVKAYMEENKGRDMSIGMGVGKLDEGQILTAKGHLERRLAATYGSNAQGKD
ncbi:oxidoreductase [Rhizodiscina lignyota]|uniref:Oxidoreductase n=1 Tax=Rhizodiscina lignyota TaxID=1504668 RepID=A0A9P4IVC1_9PEZI|nr:oxidoreductase [Rhizodiscina lignyota]